MQYKFYFYDGQPTANRSGRQSKNDGIIEEVLNFNSDASALSYAAETVYDLNYEMDFDFETAEEALDYLNSIDVGSGEAFCVAIFAGSRFVYGDEQTFDAMIAEAYPGGDVDEDTITEAIVNHPKINSYSQLQAELKALEQEVKNMETDLDAEMPSRDYARYLSADDVAEMKRLEADVDKLNGEVRSLEKQYQRYRTVWVTDHRGEAEKDFELDILDPELQAKLEPRVQELNKKIHALQSEIWKYRDKGTSLRQTAYNQKRKSLGIDDRKSRLASLKNNEKALLAEIANDVDFKEVIDDIKSNFAKWEEAQITAVNAGISNSGAFLDVELTYIVDGDKLNDWDYIEEDSYDEYKYLDTSKIIDEEWERLEEELRVFEPFTTEESRSTMDIDIDNIDIPNPPDVKFSSYPETRYEPAEEDFEIMGDVIITAELRITKLNSAD